MARRRQSFRRIRCPPLNAALPSRAAGLRVLQVRSLIRKRIVSSPAAEPTARSPFRIAVFASGGGSNLGALLRRFPHGSSIAITLVVSNRPDAPALERARQAGVPVEVVRPEDFASPDAFGGRLLDLLRRHRIDLVVLAGYLKKIPPNVVEAYPNRIVNIHPALLPHFGGPDMYGERVHAAVLAAGARESGASVHFVDPEYDRGPVIAQARVPVLPGDDAASLAGRVLAAEHELLPRVVELIAGGKVRVGPDGTVQLEEEP